MSRSDFYLQALSKPVGVGLRHSHYRDALSETSGVDFVELHSENFFADGGPTKVLLQQIGERYPISLHGTALGLGSEIGIDADYLTKLTRLVQQVKPFVVSDHASFAWLRHSGSRVHAGDLLPMPFTQTAIKVLADNIDRVQQQLGQRLLIENLVSYLVIDQHTMSEMEFLYEVTEHSGCGVLLDLNNLLVNARNSRAEKPLEVAVQQIRQLPNHTVEEFHLAGFTPVENDQLIVDDHSQPVAEECWLLYEQAIRHFGPQTTLIEWDNNLPSWQRLIEEADKARRVMHRSLQAWETNYEP